MDNTSESEKRRLQSLKERKEAFRAKELAVKNALRNLDQKSYKNRIIFDENIDKVEVNESKKRNEKKRKNLFDNNEEDDEVNWKNSDFDAKKSIRKSNITLGNDKRFKLDERFMEDDDAVDENNTAESNDGAVLENEKDWQLNVLGNLLGMPIAPRNKDNKDLKPAKKGMIRYDPTDDSHKEYEIVAEKAEPVSTKERKKKKVKESIVDTFDNAPVKVSKEIYFSVSEALTTSLKEGGQFSLLRTYEKKESDNTDKAEKDSRIANVDNTENRKHQFNFGTKNPFKYDSSDDENENEDDQNEKSTDKHHLQEEPYSGNLFSRTDKFFFDDNDVRFNEAIKFFSKESTSGDAFKHLRRELKQIVRSKIRKNIKKNQPWGGKRKLKKF